MPQGGGGGSWSIADALQVGGCTSWNAVDPELEMRLVSTLEPEM